MSIPSRSCVAQEINGGKRGSTAWAIFLWPRPLTPKNNRRILSYSRMRRCRQRRRKPSALRR